MSEARFCRVCHVLKTEKDLIKNKRAFHGVTSFCTECRKDYRKESYAQNADRERTKQRAYKNKDIQHSRDIQNTWRRNNPERVRAIKLRIYGLTPERWESIFNLQGRKCAGCGTTEPKIGQWTIDHDHACCPEICKSCGECVRGILCHPCNRALGLLGDRKTVLLNMAGYLENPPAKQVNL